MSAEVKMSVQSRPMVLRAANQSWAEYGIRRIADDERQAADRYRMLADEFRQGADRYRSLADDAWKALPYHRKLADEARQAVDGNLAIPGIANRRIEASNQ